MKSGLASAAHSHVLVGGVAVCPPRLGQFAASAADLERSEDLIIRLGDGSEESHARMQAALDTLYPFAGELWTGDAIDADISSRKIAPELTSIGAQYVEYMKSTLADATLKAPLDAAVRKGGKQGMHSEELGYILSEMQWLQRAYPGAKW